ncbi:Transforming growth factor-beta receptor-associated protein 1 [Wickerhamomyces ciferrii]|uniref:Transforming growth factor-beta receptor-associated protein 1 n=1 Tax=Wickerhamomyces ciferrii (strain ATCC 14091 / BCRC 22168 / CBS 111 / JCM 3599 / NBRC 0793 / NRRL Y-1031 F-60-10) TaxID=1206466 RepID=K0KQR8_WICCF|nr:Transforming growth factor-beta receptor-associated protein 1 [Wickerhamomyces ciferrii]CCH45426.1 Transforming growth factor-beta receptor-associated protein 1 [Wickerhamomyces ciferrii]
MAKKKKGSKANKNKQPQQRKEDDIGDSQNHNEGDGNGDVQLDLDQEHNQQDTTDHLEVPNDHRSLLKEPEVGLDSKDVTDQESDNDEKQDVHVSEEEVTNDEEQDQVPLNEDDDAQTQDFGGNDEVEQTEKSKGTVELIEDVDKNGNGDKSIDADLKDDYQTNEDPNNTTINSTDNITSNESVGVELKDNQNSTEQNSTTDKHEEYEAPKLETTDTNDETIQHTTQETDGSNETNNGDSTRDRSVTEHMTELSSATDAPKGIENVEPPPKKLEPTILNGISPGPFSIHDIITEIPLHNPDVKGSEHSFPTYVEKLDDHIYIGTSHGELLHFFKIENEYILVSRNSFHQARTKPITKILLLPKLEKALVLSGGLFSCFLLPEFSPANIGRVKDVNDISLDHDHSAKNDATGVHVAVYSNQRIRIINVTPKALRLVKDIAYPDSQKGLRRSEYSLVASKENYDLIDLENTQKIPLFPILTVQDETGGHTDKLEPFILPVGHDEFLLTCGLSQDEPAMGLVVNVNGDISRGTIPFSKYPESIGVVDPYTIATFDGNISINSLNDQTEVQTIEFNNPIKVCNITSPFIEPHPELIDLIKRVPIVGQNKEQEVQEFDFASKTATISSSLVTFCTDFIKILLPQPRLIRLIKFTSVQQLEDEIKSIDGSTELGVIELEYINILIALTLLKNRTYNQAFEVWTSGIIDPRLLVYIFKYEVFGTLWLFNGLKDVVDELRKGIKETKFRKFFVKFLDKWIEKESFIENQDILKSIELADLKESLDDDIKILNIVDRYTNVALDDIVDILKSNKKFTALAKVYTKQEKYREVLGIYKDLVDGKKPSHALKKDDGLTLVIDLIYKHFSKDEDLVWETGLWLIKKNPELGLNYFQNENLDIKIKDETVLISKIDDVSLKYKYVEKLLVKLNKEKMKTNLVKNLYKTELKSLNDRIKAYRNHSKS